MHACVSDGRADLECSSLQDPERRGAGNHAPEAVLAVLLEREALLPCQPARAPQETISTAMLGKHGGQAAGMYLASALTPIEDHVVLHTA